MLVLRSRNQPSQRIWCMHDVRIREPKIIRRKTGGVCCSFLQCPQLSRPPRLQLRSSEYHHALLLTTRWQAIPSKRSGPIVAMVIHHNDLKVPWIVLVHQRPHAARNRVRFISRRHHCHHSRPFLHLFAYPSVAIQRPELPKPPTKKSENNPDEQGKTSNASY